MDDTARAGCSRSRVQLPRLVGVLSVLVAMLAAVSFFCWALIAAVHADDLYANDAKHGVWVSLVAEAKRGLFYPPLYDGDSFGGTRYMPAQIATYAAAAKVTGELVLSAKLVVYVLAVLLFGLLFITLRQLGCPKLVALGLSAVVLASNVGLLTSTAVAGDTLPVLLQLGALLAVSRKRGSWSMAGAGVMCALALLAKFTALWAPAAILIWLLARDRSRVAVFLASFAATLAAGIATAEVVSHGRFSQNLLALSVSSFRGFQGAGHKFITLLELNAIPVVVMLPFVLVSLLLTVVERRITLYHLSVLFAIGILFVVFGDPGTDRNQLLDMSVLSVVVVGDLWGRTEITGGGDLTVQVLILAATFCAIGLGLFTDVKPQVLDAVHRTNEDAYAVNAPAGVFGPRDRILSQDPYVYVALGERPEVLDPYALLRLFKKHPRWQQDLIARLDGHKYDKVVLHTSLGDSGWWENIDFGAPVIKAIEKNYILSQRLRWRDLSIYVPRQAPAAQ